MTSLSVQDGGMGEIIAGLDDPRHRRQTLQMLSRATRENWDMKPDQRQMIVGKLLGIVERDSSTVLNSDGEEVEISNARNQATAARVLVQMDALNQTDYWNADKNRRMDDGKPTELHAVMPAIVEQPVRVTE